MRRSHVELLEHVPVDPQVCAHRLVANLLAEDLGPDRVVALLDVDLPGDLPLAIQEEATTPTVTARPERGAKTAHPLLGWFRWVADDDGPVEDRLGGGQVLLQQQRRERQHVADVVEPVTDVIVGEVGRGLEVDADEIADRVVILGPVEPADRDAAVIARPGAVAPAEHVVDRPGRQLGFRGAWPRPTLRLGWHLARPDHLDDVFPDFAVLHQRLLVVILVEHQVAFTLAAAVAGVAMLGQERNDILVEAGGGGLPGRR